MLELLVLHVVTGLGLALLSLPLIYKKIKPNPLYGFRVRRTLENPEVWYKANEYAGERMLRVGICISLAALLLFFIPGITLEIYSLGVLGVVVAGLTIAVIQSVRYLNRL